VLQITQVIEADFIVTKAADAAILEAMQRTDIYLKVVVLHNPPDTPEKIAAEICRQVSKVYGVRKAEVSNFVTQPSDEE
jgi:hypothetical protein